MVCLWEEDAIRIANPGDFRVDIASALRGGESDPRNENLLKMFSYIDVGERAGSGLPKIVEGWTECGYPAPSYEESFGPDRTTLTLPLVARDLSGFDSSESDKSRNRTKESGGTGNSRQSKAELTKDAIVAFLQSSGQGSRADVVAGTSLSPSRASELLNELVAEGRLVAEGSTRNRVYKAVDANVESRGDDV